MVLHGAKALAVPLKFGQRMVVHTIPGPGILRWETYVLGKIWFTGSFNQNNLEILEASEPKTAIFLQKLLKAGRKLNPDPVFQLNGFYIQNYIDFDINWGLGSSSSLVSNLAWWLDISPYNLYRELYQGSGYDVFCARSGRPIIYQLINNLPSSEEILFNPKYSDHLYFVYLGRKQDSQQSVMHFKTKSLNDERLIGKISELTDSLLNADTLEDFMTVMRLHEEIISSILGLKQVKEELFPDFQGEIKSLGAWGGDFVMAATPISYHDVIDYFRNKNLQVVFKWNEII